MRSNDTNLIWSMASITKCAAFTVRAEANTSIFTIRSSASPQVPYRVAGGQAAMMIRRAENVGLSWKPALFGKGYVVVTIGRTWYTLPQKIDRARYEHAWSAQASYRSTSSQWASAATGTSEDGSGRSRRSLAAGEKGVRKLAYSCATRRAARRWPSSSPSPAPGERWRTASPRSRTRPGWTTTRSAAAPGTGTSRCPCWRNVPRRARPRQPRQQRPGRG
jgi:hypothetical protein